MVVKTKMIIGGKVMKIRIRVVGNLLRRVKFASSLIVHMGGYLFFWARPPSNRTRRHIDFPVLPGTCFFWIVCHVAAGGVIIRQKRISF